MNLSTELLDILTTAQNELNREKTADSNPYTVDAVTNWYVNLINAAILGQIFAIFGVVTNLINIVVFTKMGFKDPINISLLGLSISDFLSCLPLLWMNLTRTPGFTELDLPFEPFPVGYITGTWPHLTMVKVTSCITAFITLERCLCVVFPLKVKEMITPVRVTVITIGLYVFAISFAVPTFYFNRLEGVYNPELNKTLVTLTFTEDREDIEAIAFAMFGVLLPFVTFFATIVFTIVLVIALRKNASWRKKVTRGDKTSGSEGTSSRDEKVSRMVIMISALFIACFSPIMISTFFIVAIPVFRTIDAEGNVMFLVFSFIYLLETTNASLNIFIYYNRSSNYKATFDKIFRKKLVGKSER